MTGIVDRRAILIAVDSIAAFGAVLVGVWLRFGSSVGSTWQSLDLPSLWIVASAFAVLTFTSFGAAGAYRTEIYWDLRSELRDFARGLVLLGFTSLAFLFVFKLEDVSRIAIVLSFAALMLAGVMNRLVLRAAAASRASRGEALRNWVVVGAGEEMTRVSQLLEAHPHVGAGIIGIVSDSDPGDLRSEWLGTIYDLPEILSQHVVDEVLVSGESDNKRLDAVLSVCAAQGKTVRLAMDSVAPTALRGRMEEYGGIPMWSVLATPEYRLELAMKRVVDVLGSLFALLILSPAFLVISVATLAADGRPIFYKQRRGGHHGREFTMLKFRTMINGAESLRADLQAENERAGPIFKIESDPRVTRFGAFLRRSSLDETPQFVNVLLGHMSLVGPRPQPLEEVAEYDLWHRRRLSMRPGITGLWQIRARNDPSFDTWMDNDLEYIDRWSLLLDLWILMQTPHALVRTPGT